MKDINVYITETVRKNIINEAKEHPFIKKEIKTEKKGILGALNVCSDFKKVEKHSMMLGLSCLACVKESVVSTINKEFCNMKLQKKRDISRGL